MRAVSAAKREEGLTPHEALELVERGELCTPVGEVMGYSMADLIAGEEAPALDALTHRPK